MSIFGWAYPPGVTGLEPAITGEWPVDLHNPYEAGDKADSEHELWPVWDARDEDLPPGSEHPSEAEAEAVARQMNKEIPACRDQVDERDCCVICGEPDWGKLEAERLEDERIIDLQSRRPADGQADDEGPRAA